LPDRHAGADGQQQLRAVSFADSLPRLAYGGGSQHTIMLRHAHAIEMAHEGIPLPIIQRQLGHAHLGITSIYLQGIDTREIVDTVHHRRPPVIPASAGGGNNENQRGAWSAHRAPLVHRRPPVCDRTAGERYRCCPESAARGSNTRVDGLAASRQYRQRADVAQWLLFVRGSSA
jgi:hypothetical protein